ncbi:DUF924 family protein [Bradyrhizobium lablabi]|uniref:DUF924 family protein n=1 Tax=Bradyrhizobium lablabi TaxID=722472 RepID=UPI001BA55D2E|nr:DUF924 family protein [Bradyrhizobium lablabi]MBR1121591.1 DUF924 family protein [Bradyrhizobium lablabi]
MQCWTISGGAATREGYLEQQFHSGSIAASSVPASVPIRPSGIIAFWSEAGPSLWFAKDDAFDRRFRETFMEAHEAACRGDLDHWQRTPGGALALILLLDQFPRNAFRGTPRMYASDAKALAAADAAIAAGRDRHFDADLRLFFYLPFAHSEALADQERSVALCRALDEKSLAHAEGHRDIVKRFGRFPHRNLILGRMMTEEEQRFLDAGGYSG